MMNWFRLGCLVTLFMALYGVQVPLAQAYSAHTRYIPPEIVYADDLRQRVTLPQRLNLNRAGLNDLKTLPGFDEELALKVMRNRPFEDVQDFYRKMPEVGTPRIDRLIQQIQPKVIFK